MAAFRAFVLVLRAFVYMPLPDWLFTLHCDVLIPLARSVVGIFLRFLLLMTPRDDGLFSLARRAVGFLLPFLMLIYPVDNLSFRHSAAFLFFLLSSVYRLFVSVGHKLECVACVTIGPGYQRLSKCGIHGLICYWRLLYTYLHYKFSWLQGVGSLGYTTVLIVLCLTNLLDVYVACKTAAGAVPCSSLGSNYVKLAAIL